MAWNQAVVTNAGRTLAAAVTAGKLKLEITEIWFGSGNPGNQETATELGNKQIQAGIVGIEQQGMDCLITFMVSNENKTTNTVLSEIGIYALDEAGHTILFSTLTDPEPGTLPKQAANEAIYKQRMTLAFGYSNADSVELQTTVIDGVPKDEMDGAISAKVAEHNVDKTAHEDFTGATAEAAGQRGMVPAPPQGMENAFLNGDGRWVVPDNFVTKTCYIEKEADFEAYKDYNSYILRNDIKITKPISQLTKSNASLNLNGFKITLDSNFNGDHIFHMDDTNNVGSRCQHIIRNGTIDCNGVDCTIIRWGGIVWRLNVIDLLIYNAIQGLFRYDGVGGGAENKIDNVTIYHADHDDTNIGCEIRFGDSHITKLFVVFFKEAVRVSSGSNNYFTECHVWGYPKTTDRQYSDNLIMNKGFNILSNYIYFTNCTSDTPEPIDDTQDASYANGGYGFCAAISEITLLNCIVIVHPQTSSDKHIGYIWLDTSPSSGKPNYLSNITMIHCAITMSKGVPFKCTPVYTEKDNITMIGCQFERDRFTTVFRGKTQIAFDKGFTTPPAGVLATYDDANRPTYMYGDKMFAPCIFSEFYKANLEQANVEVAKVIDAMGNRGYPLLYENQANGDIYIYSYKNKRLKKITVTEIV